MLIRFMIIGSIRSQVFYALTVCFVVCLIVSFGALISNLTFQAAAVDGSVCVCVCLCITESWLSFHLIYP
jgi:hypothetical protein